MLRMRRMLLRRRYYSTQCTDISQQTGAHHPI
jgi:hypothetical protein